MRLLLAPPVGAPNERLAHTHLAMLVKTGVQSWVFSGSLLPSALGPPLWGSTAILGLPCCTSQSIDSMEEELARDIKGATKMRLPPRRWDGAEWRGEHPRKGKITTERVDRKANCQLALASWAMERRHVNCLVSPPTKDSDGLFPVLAALAT
eukprot:scaffold168444_cov31-Tisochrysis_lutea.AAC.2